MGNSLSKELAVPYALQDHAELQGDNSNAIGISKRWTKVFLLAKEKLVNVVYSSKHHCGEDKLKMTLSDIDKLYEKYSWLRELGREYITE